MIEIKITEKEIDELIELSKRWKEEDVTITLKNNNIHPIS